MFGRWPAGLSVGRAAVASAWLLICQIGLAPAIAEAAPAILGSRALWSWTAETAAQALQAAEANREVAGGGIAALNHGLRRGHQLLREAGPGWLGRIDLDLQVREGWQVAYAIATTQPVIDRPRNFGQLSLRGRFAFDPGGVTGSRVGLIYRREVGGRPLAVSLDGGLEERWLLDYHRLTLASELRLSGLELRARLHDDVPGAERARDGLEDRPLDGYQLDARMRLPFVHWAWASAGRSWQAACDAEDGVVSDRFSLLLRPLLPVELEAGTTGGDGPRSWFARLRLALKLGA
ncbi:MAG: hypothetical protein ACREH3_01585 [Geminicoccales bacterium]